MIASWLRVRCKLLHALIYFQRTEPFIRYTEDEEATSTQQQQQQQRQLQQQQNEPRAVAKKSVSRQESQNTSQQFTPVPVVRHLNNSTIYLEDENKPKGKVCSQ